MSLPQEPAPFRALTHSVHQAFPAFPPFGGRFDEVVPHLTIGYGHPLSDLRAAEEAVQAHLPIEARASRVGLMAQLSPGGQWVKTASFSFSAVAGLIVNGSVDVKLRRWLLPL